MITMEKTPYGLHIIVSGTITEEESLVWCQSIPPKVTPIVFNLLVLLDVIDANIIPKGAKKHLLDGFDLLLDSNLTRVSVLYQSFSVYLQVENILEKAGVTSCKFFNANSPSFRRFAREWLIT